MNWGATAKTFFIILLLFLNRSCKEDSTGPDPNTITPIESEHFSFVLYDGLSASTSTPILEKLNTNYDRILNDLSVPSIPKVKIEIWSDETHFQNDMKRDIGTNYWGSTGYIYNKTTLRILKRGDNLPQTALHEFAHIVSLQVNSSFGNNPRWFWEAVATYESGEFVHPRDIPYLAAGNFPTLEELNTDFNSGNQKIYSVGYLLSEYIIEAWGKESYVRMIKFNANLGPVLNVTTLQFETGWKGFVTKKYL